MKVILQILPRLNSGGVERGTIEISQAIIDAGFKSIIVSNGGKLEYLLKKQGATHITLPVDKKNPWIIWQNIKKIEKIIDIYEVDIIHARSRVPAWSAYFASKNKNITFITTFHGVYSGNSKLKKHYNKIMLRGKKIIAVSNFIKNHIKEKYHYTNNNIEVIHRGVDLSYFDESKVSINQSNRYLTKFRIPENKKIILLPGRLTNWKGQHIFIKSLAKLKRDDFYAVIIGDDDDHSNYKGTLEKLIEELNLSERILLHNAVPDIINIYHFASVIISSSLRPEAFGRIMIEAGNMQKIIIATNHGGATETILDGNTGFLVKPNDIDDLADKINYVLDMSEEEKEIMGEKAHKYIAENFSLAKMQEKTINIYKSL